MNTWKGMCMSQGCTSLQVPWYYGNRWGHCHPNKETRKRFKRSKSKALQINMAWRKSAKEMLLGGGFCPWHSIGLDLVAAIPLYASNSTQSHSYCSSLEIVAVTSRSGLLSSLDALWVCVGIHWSLPHHHSSSPLKRSTLCWVPGVLMNTSKSRFKGLKATWCHNKHLSG